MPAKPSRDTPEQPVIARLVADLPSSSFAFIMATGIVSIAGASLDYGQIAVLLLRGQLGRVFTAVDFDAAPPNLLPICYCCGSA